MLYEEARNVLQQLGWTGKLASYLCLLKQLEARKEGRKQTAIKMCSCPHSSECSVSLWAAAVWVAGSSSQISRLGCSPRGFAPRAAAAMEHPLSPITFCHRSITQLPVSTVTQ